jgi:hypothetical protein
MRWATCDGFIVEPQNHPVAGFAEFGPQNLVVAVPTGIGDDTCRHHQGCIEAKQLCTKCVAVRSKS